MAETLQDAVARRRTFAIIAHPDAGKTTLTEKLLLFGGAIQLAGEVKAKKDRIQTRSDWMKIERERGISVVTSVMTFEYDGNVFNILDTPGHEDFADDTYRTLTAVDAAVMVIDAAKGIEPRTLKLFEVCRMRDIPIITFINKMDRESRDPFEILDEVEEKLALDTAPITWPVGRSKTFCGAYNLAANAFRGSDSQVEATPVNGPQAVADRLPENERETFVEELELAREACRPFDRQSFLEGHMTPVFFGSALRNFGVRDLINALGAFAPPPRRGPSIFDPPAEASAPSGRHPRPGHRVDVSARAFGAPSQAAPQADGLRPRLRRMVSDRAFGARPPETRVGRRREAR